MTVREDVAPRPAAPVPARTDRTPPARLGRCRPPPGSARRRRHRVRRSGLQRSTGAKGASTRRRAVPMPMPELAPVTTIVPSSGSSGRPRPPSAQRHGSQPRTARWRIEEVPARVHSSWPTRRSRSRGLDRRRAGRTYCEDGLARRQAGSGSAGAQALFGSLAAGIGKVPLDVGLGAPAGRALALGDEGSPRPAVGVRRGSVSRPPAGRRSCRGERRGPGRSRPLWRCGPRWRGAGRAGCRCAGISGCRCIRARGTPETARMLAQSWAKSTPSAASRSRAGVRRPGAREQRAHRRRQSPRHWSK